MIVTVTLEPTTDGRWSAYTPDDFACALAGGATRDEALQNLKAAPASNRKTAGELGMPTIEIDGFKLRD